MRLAPWTPRSRAATPLVGVVVPDPLPAAPGLEERFRAFYQLVYGPALDFAEHFASRMDAEDAVHDALGEIWIRWRAQGPDTLTVRYFLGIVRHKLRARRRTEKRRQSVSLADAAEELDALAVRAHAAPTRVDTAGDVLDLAIATMPPKRREAMLLTRVHDFTYKEAGAVLRVSEETVRSHVRLGNAQVRTAFAGTTFEYARSRPAQLPQPAQEESREREDPADD